LDAATRWARLSARVSERTGRSDGPASAGDVCVVCVETLGADGGALSLSSARRSSALLRAVGAHGRDLADLQFTLGEGPKEDVLETGKPELTEDLAARPAKGRWPRFAPAAVSRGIRAVHAFPLGSPTIRVGVLQVYYGVPHSLTNDEFADAQVFADIALDALVDPDPVAREVKEVDLGGRAVLYQATGILSVELGVSLEDALDQLKSYAQENNTPITDVAQAVVSGELRLR
jgi:hypothetical protein